jgi:hypothetical protein
MRSKTAPSRCDCRRTVRVDRVAHRARTRRPHSSTDSTHVLRLCRLSWVGWFDAGANPSPRALRPWTSKADWVFDDESVFAFLCGHPPSTPVLSITST